MNMLFCFHFTYMYWHFHIKMKKNPPAACAATFCLRRLIYSVYSIFVQWEIIHVIPLMPQPQTAHTDQARDGEQKNNHSLTLASCNVCTQLHTHTYTLLSLYLWTQTHVWLHWVWDLHRSHVLHGLAATAYSQKQQITVHTGMEVDRTWLSVWPTLKKRSQC